MNSFGKAFRMLAIALLKFYKMFLSPITSYFGAKCRHSPSCSTYGITAMGRFGVWRGGWLLLSRLLRCHPWGTSGHDPVPQAEEPVPFWAVRRMGNWAWHIPNNDISPDTTARPDNNGLNDQTTTDK